MAMNVSPKPSKLEKTINTYNCKFGSNYKINDKNALYHHPQYQKISQLLQTNNFPSPEKLL